MHLAAEAFASDLHKVTGVKPKLYNDTLPHHVKEAIVVGVAGDEVLSGDELSYLEDIKGLWEAFDVRVVKGVKGLERALVIAGSNKVPRVPLAGLSLPS